MDTVFSVGLTIAVVGAFVWAYLWLVRSARKDREAVLLALVRGPMTVTALMNRLGPNTDRHTFMTRLRNMEADGLIARSHTAGGTVYYLDEKGEMAAWRVKDAQLGPKKPNQT